MDPFVDEYIDNSERWYEELTFLRSLLLGLDLTEEAKWKSPCYTYNGKIILLLQAFKNHCAISYFKGSLLADPDKLFKKVPETTQFLRQIKLTSLSQIQDIVEQIIAYTYEAIEIEKAGLEVQVKHISEYEVPIELENAFKKIPELKVAFDKLTPGRQRSYLLHFSTAKQAKTRESRIAKNIDRILAVKGRSDCICGLSRRMPNCDGSHKALKAD